MPVYPVEDKRTIAPLFDGWQETFIGSCLQDCMGIAYADDLHNPTAAQISVGDFCCFGGKPNAELVCNKPANIKHGFAIFVPQDEAWAEMIERCYGQHAKRCMRYATRKEPDAFDKQTLERCIKKLPQGYALRMIDETLFSAILKLEWARDLCINYACYADYQAAGLGVAALRNGEVCAGASSYIYYPGGIEIEIDTREDERRKGLALACGAKLILECIARSWYPSWDAHSRGSLALAQKLGYHFDKEYPAYEITGWL